MVRLTRGSYSVVCLGMNLQRDKREGRLHDDVCDKDGKVDKDDKGALSLYAYRSINK